MRQSLQSRIPENGFYNISISPFFEMNLHKNITDFMAKIGHYVSR